MKKVLVIHPDLPNDSFISKISKPAALKVINKAIGEGWTVTSLSGNNANKTNVNAKLNDPLFKFVLHFDHGDKDALGGQNNDQKQVVIDNTNVDKLNGMVVSTLSCFSAWPGGIGSSAITNGAKAYLGYSSTYWPWYGENDCLCDFFINAASAAKHALLEGKKFQEACQIGKTAHYEAASFLLQIRNIIQMYFTPSEELEDIIDDLETAAGCLEWCGDHLTVLGDPTQKAI